MPTKSNSIMDHPDSELPTAVSDSEELIAKLDNEALLAKFVDVNANFIAVGPLARQFQELRYSQLRDELYRIDLQIRRRALLGTPAHKAAVKAAHDQAWQIARIARPNSPVRGSGRGGRQSPDPAARQDPAPASISAAALASQKGDWELADPVARQDSPSASTSAAAPASLMGEQESADPVAPQDTPPASTSAATPASQMGDWEPADPVARQDPPPASTSTVPSRTILAAWRDAIFTLGHRRHDAQ